MNNEIEVSKTQGGVILKGSPTRYIPGPKGAMSIVGKLCLIMKHVGAVPKRGWNKHFEFAYVMEDDLTNAVRAALAEQNVMLIFGVESISVDLMPAGPERKKDSYSTLVMTSHMLIDGDSGEQIVFQCGGHASKSDDKGLTATCTLAQKTIIQKIFLIPSEEPEPESDAGATYISDVAPQAAPGRYPTASEDPAVQARIAHEEAKFAAETNANAQAPSTPRTTRSHASAARTTPKPDPTPAPAPPQYPEWCDVIKSCGDQHKGKTMAWIALEDEKSLKNWQDNWQPKPTRPGGPIPPAQAEFRAALDASMKDPIANFHELKDIVTFQNGVAP